MFRFRRLGVNVVKRSRAFSVANHPTVKGYKEKTFVEAWCSDTGAYPVMGVIVFAVIFSLGWGIKVMATSPDARISKRSRTAILRGEGLISEEEKVQKH